jgi:hypothetical protein
MRLHITCREMKNTYKILVGKPELKRMLVGLRHRWENNIKLNPIKIGCVSFHRFNWLGTDISGMLL